MGAHHGFVMGGSDDHAVLIRHHGVERVVVGERLAPHGGPQIVALEPQGQFEHAGVEMVVEAAEGLVDPAVQGRVLVVQENAAISHAGAVGAAAGQDVQVALTGHGNVGPPDPGRDAHALGQIIDAIDGAAHVRSGDDQRPVHARRRIVDHLLDKGLPLAGHVRDVQTAVGDQGVDDGVAAQGSDDDRQPLPRLMVERRGRTGHPLQIAAQIGGGAQQARVVAGIGAHHGGAARGDQGEGVAGRGAGADRARGLAGGSGQGRAEPQKTKGQKARHETRHARLLSRKGAARRSRRNDGRSGRISVRSGWWTADRPSWVRRGW